MAKKILLFYCTILTLFINISGIWAVKRPQDYILQAVFLPVTLFLIYSSVKTIFGKKTEKNTENAPAAKPVLSVILLLILFSIAFAARTISQPQEIVSPIPSLRYVPTIAPTPTPAIPEKVTIRAENLKTPINVRNDPASNSAIFAKTKSGETFPCLGFNNGWYKIKLTSGKSGWVFGEFITEGKEIK